VSDEALTGLRIVNAVIAFAALAAYAAVLTYRWGRMRTGARYIGVGVQGLLAAVCLGSITRAIDMPPEIQTLGFTVALTGIFAALFYDLTAIDGEGSR
jgi:ribose/xylose/arabinose/galactoside ABC-type transport system permease subunit